MSLRHDQNQSFDNLMILKLLHVLSILDDIVSPKVYNERDDFNFEIINSLVLGEDVPHSIYNHATSNLAIYSHETSQDKLPEAI